MLLYRHKTFEKLANKKLKQRCKAKGIKLKKNYTLLSTLAGVFGIIYGLAMFFNLIRVIPMTPLQSMLYFYPIVAWLIAMYWGYNYSSNLKFETDIGFLYLQHPLIPQEYIKKLIRHKLFSFWILQLIVFIPFNIKLLALGNQETLDHWQILLVLISGFMFQGIASLTTLFMLLYLFPYFPFFRVALLYLSYGGVLYFLNDATQYNTLLASLSGSGSMGSNFLLFHSIYSNQLPFYTIPILTTILILGYRIIKIQTEKSYDFPEALYTPFDLISEEAIGSDIEHDDSMDEESNLTPKPAISQQRKTLREIALAEFEKAKKTNRSHINPKFLNRFLTNEERELFYALGEEPINLFTSSKIYLILYTVFIISTIISFYMFPQYREPIAALCIFANLIPALFTLNLFKLNSFGKIGLIGYQSIIYIFLHPISFKTIQKIALKIALLRLIIIVPLSSLFTLIFLYGFHCGIASSLSLVIISESLLISLFISLANPITFYRRNYRSIIHNAIHILLEVLIIGLTSSFIFLAILLYYLGHPISAALSSIISIPLALASLPINVKLSKLFLLDAILPPPKSN